MAPLVLMGLMAGNLHVIRCWVWMPTWERYGGSSF